MTTTPKSWLQSCPALNDLGELTIPLNVMLPQADWITILRLAPELGVDLDEVVNEILHETDAVNRLQDSPMDGPAPDAAAATLGWVPQRPIRLTLGEWGLLLNLARTAGCSLDAALSYALLAADAVNQWCYAVNPDGP